MPVYEFYCRDCHTVFNFFSRRVDTTTRPACPRCRRPKLQRQVSRFATLGKAAEGHPLAGRGEDLPPGMDESKMESLMESMASEADGLDEDNPQQIARMMRKLHEASGMPLDQRAEEAIRRMEAGESPEKIEEELGDVFGEGEPDLDAPAGRSRKRSRQSPPAVDTTLYDL
jgi:putative FmdB family regulatory protein